MTHVAVIGGGISGLAAAHRLRTLLGPTARITVLEQRGRVGGVLRTVELAGVPIDVGAESFLARRPEVLDLVAELGLGHELAHPTGAAPSIRAGGRTGPLPSGTLLGVPTSAARLDVLLSPRQVAAAAAEPARPLRWVPGADVALGGLLRERFGDEVVDRLVDPLLGGVYAGRVDELGLRATVPALAATLDAGAPSLTAAADRAVSADRLGRPGQGRELGAAGPVFAALRGGYRVLLDALTGDDIRLGTTVRALQRRVVNSRAAGWRLVLGPVPAPEILDVDAVVLAVPAPALARLLAPHAAAAARAAAQVRLASSAVVALAFRAVSFPPTSGLLVAAGEPLSVKGVTHSSTKWAHLGADGLVRVRASIGRFGEEATLQVDDAELVARVRRDLRTLTGVEAEPVDAVVQRWGGGLPQYGVGHLDLVATLEEGLPPGLAVAGSALHGVGVPACVATGRAAAQRVATTMAAWPASTTPR